MGANLTCTADIVQARWRAHLRFMANDKNDSKNDGHGAMLILGAGGYLGTTTIEEAVAAGRRVIGLVRSEAAATKLRSLGAEAVVGDAARPNEWHAALVATDVIIDLIQPAFPARITTRALDQLARERLELTQTLCAAIMALPPARRPTYVSVGGIEELAATDDAVTDTAQPHAAPAGGGRIGAPAHQALLDSGVPLASVYLGMVYGAGKVFASSILPGIVAGSFPIPGSGKNRLPLIHVEDAARALVHIAGLGRQVTGKSFVVAHPGGSTAQYFFDAIASELGARRPRRLPGWLVGWVAGRGALELMIADARVEPRRLLESGFVFRYPSLDRGVKAMVDAFRAKRAALQGPPGVMGSRAR
jgi:nucleoside-diphosphate-sugar epimerase